MSISLKMQDERDLKYMKVIENSITRSEEKDIKYRNVLAKYDQKLKKIEKTHEEQRKDRSESAQTIQAKRNHVKGNKDRTIDELNTTAYNEYIDYIQKRRVFLFLFISIGKYTLEQQRKEQPD